MPDLLKKPNGDTDYSKIFMGFAMALVIVLQQWQSYRIAEIQAQAKANSIQYMPKDQVLAEFNRFMSKEEILEHLNKIEKEVTQP